MSALNKDVTVLLLLQMQSSSFVIRLIASSFFRDLFQMVTFLSSSFVFGSETTIETFGSHGLDDKSWLTCKLSLASVDIQEVPRSK
jgi:hypothetical protein